MTNTDDSIFFDYVDANGVSKKSEVLTLFRIDNSEKYYAMCSIPSDDGNYDITAFIVNSTSPNTVSFDDITDPNELNTVSKVVASIING